MDQQPRLRRLLGSPRARLALVLLALSVAGAVTVRDYGLTIDEPGAVFLPKWHYDHVVDGKPFEREIVSYDGTLLSFVAEAVYQAKHWAQGPSQYQFLRTFSAKDRPVEQIITGRTRIRHPLVFCAFLLTAVAVAGLVALLCGIEYAWLGPLILALFPRFWGHSFFNFKDVPFAALFTCATLYGAYLVAQFLAADAPLADGATEQVEQPRRRRRWPRLVLHSLGFGMLIGLLCGVRVGGFVVIGFLLVTHIALWFSSSVAWRHALPIAGCYALMSVACFGVTIACYPSSWSDPLGWFPQAMEAVSKYPWDKSVLFEGRFVRATQLPWHYLPKWILISVPLLWLACATAGLLVLLGLLLRRNAASIAQRAGIILLLLQCFAIPVVVIARGSTMYDGMRHNLFILPAMAVAATCFVAWIYRRMPTGGARVAAGALLGLLALPIAWDMIRLHPYQYVYFNRAAGSLRAAQERYETDYWGLSAREAIEWLNRNGDRSRPIVTGAPQTIIKPFAHAAWRFEQLKDDDAALAPLKPFYYLAMPKHGLQYRFPKATTIHAVERQGGTLTIVQWVE